MIGMVHNFVLFLYHDNKEFGFWLWLFIFNIKKNPPVGSGARAWNLPIAKKKNKNKGRLLSTNIKWQTICWLELSFLWYTIGIKSDLDKSEYSNNIFNAADNGATD